MCDLCFVKQTGVKAVCGEISRCGRMVVCGRRNKHERMVVYGRRNKHERMVVYGRRNKHERMVVYGRRNKHERMVVCGRRNKHEKKLIHRKRLHIGVEAIQADSPADRATTTAGQADGRIGGSSQGPQFLLRLVGRWDVRFKSVP